MAFLRHGVQKFVSKRALANYLAKEQRRVRRLNDGTTLVMQENEPSLGKKGEVFKPKRAKLIVDRFNPIR